MAFGKQPDEYSYYSIRTSLDLHFIGEREKKYKDLICMSLLDVKTKWHFIYLFFFKDPFKRPSFHEIQKQLNFLLECKYDAEIIVQSNDFETLKEAVSLGIHTVDSLGRNLVHECCMYGNLISLEYLVTRMGQNILKSVDNFNCGCTHFAGLTF